MKCIYFLVTQLQQYNDKYSFHSDYFEHVNNISSSVSGMSAFGQGVLCSLIIGAVVALAFYFGLCNGNNNRYVKRENWWIGLAIVAVVAYFVGSFLIIGKDGNPGTGFYASIQDFANQLMVHYQGNQQVINDIQDELNTILENLNHGNDVAMMFNITNAVLSVLIYFIVSVSVKKLTRHGSQIPF